MVSVAAQRREVKKVKKILLLLFVGAGMFAVLLMTGCDERQGIIAEDEYRQYSVTIYNPTQENVRLVDGTKMTTEKGAYRLIGEVYVPKQHHTHALVEGDVILESGTTLSIPGLWHFRDLKSIFAVAK